MINIANYIGDRNITTEDVLTACLSANHVTILDDDDMSRNYDDMLDEIYSLECVGGIFAYMSASRVLEDVDPIAYRCGYDDYIDSVLDDHTDFGGTLYINDDDLTEVLDELIAQYNKGNEA